MICEEIEQEKKEKERKEKERKEKEYMKMCEERKREAERRRTTISRGNRWRRVHPVTGAVTRDFQVPSKKQRKSSKITKRRSHRESNYNHKQSKSTTHLLAVSSGSKKVTLAQSKSDVVDGKGYLYDIRNDTSKPIRERLNKFTRKLSIRRVTDLDIYTFDMDSNCLHMGCGHGMPKETLFAYAEAQFKEGQKSLKCPHLKNPDESKKLCERPWPS